LVRRAADGATVRCRSTLIDHSPLLKTTLAARVSYLTVRMRPDPPSAGQPPPERLNAVSGVRRGFVLPYVDDVPTESVQRTILQPVACHILLEFLQPPFPVVLRQAPVLRAPVPEAAVDEDSEFRTG